MRVVMTPYIIDQCGVYSLVSRSHCPICLESYLLTNVRPIGAMMIGATVNRVPKDGHVIPSDVRSTISTRYKRITKPVNQEFWNSSNEAAHSLYVGSYGRGTAVEGSDLDVLMVLPRDEYDHYDDLKGDGQSRLLQAVKESVSSTLSRTDVRADGQVVVVNYSDGMKFEILPAFERYENLDPTPHYVYPDTHMGCRWLPTNPRAEQAAMKDKNGSSRGLLFDTCQHIRYIHNEHFKNYDLSGIVIDSFIYEAIESWRWTLEGEKGAPAGSYERHLLDRYNEMIVRGESAPILWAPGSKQQVDTRNSYVCLGKVLIYIAG